LLRVFGAKVSSTCNIYPGAEIWAPWNIQIGEVVGIADRAVLYSQARIEIADHVTISQEAYLCTGSHDYNSPQFTLWTAPIIIGRNSWVAARAFVHPGVCIGQNAVIGACAVVTRDVADGAIVAGNPAKVIRIRK
jgi:putative colanic acid biosynthesis acetyltransferase WcaF